MDESTHSLKITVGRRCTCSGRTLRLKADNKKTELTRQTSATAFHNLCLDDHEVSAKVGKMAGQSLPLNVWLESAWPKVGIFRVIKFGLPQSVATRENVGLMPLVETRNLQRARAAHRWRFVTFTVRGAVQEVTLGGPVMGFPLSSRRVGPRCTYLLRGKANRSSRRASKCGT